MTKQIQFNAFKSNPAYNLDIRAIRNAYQERYEMASSIAGFPSYWFGGNVSSAAALSVCKKALRLMELGREAYYRDINYSWRSQITVWRKMVSYLESQNRDSNTFERFGGVNNPFITDNAILVEG